MENSADLPPYLQDYLKSCRKRIPMEVGVELQLFETTEFESGIIEQNN